MEELRVITGTTSAYSEKMRLHTIKAIVKLPLLRLCACAGFPYLDETSTCGGYRKGVGQGRDRMTLIVLHTNITMHFGRKIPRVKDEERNYSKFDCIVTLQIKF